MLDGNDKSFLRAQTLAIVAAILKAEAAGESRMISTETAVAQAKALLNAAEKP